MNPQLASLMTLLGNKNGLPPMTKQAKKPLANKVPKPSLPKGPVPQRPGFMGGR